MLLADLPSLDIEFSQVVVVAGISVAILIVLNGLLVLSTSRRRGKQEGRNWFSRMLYLAFLVMITVLAVSSFASIFLYGHMSGYALLVHVGAAGAFVFLLLAIALLYLPTGNPSDPLGPGDQRWWLARWSAWLLVVGAIVTAGTMFLSMLPVLDTQELLDVAELHRYAGLVVVVAAIFHLYALLCTKLGLR